MNTWMSRVTRMKEACHTYMPHSYDSFICVTWLIHMCDMTHSYVWHDSFICDMTHWLRDMTHWCVRYDSSIYVIWLIHMYAMTESYMWRDPFICVTWLSLRCDVTRTHKFFLDVIFTLKNHNCLHTNIHLKKITIFDTRIFYVIFT